MVWLIATAACLEFGNVFQNFICQTGEGGNGKGTTKDLVEGCFGSLSGVLDKLAIQEKMKDVTAARSDLADLAHKKIIFINELDKAMPIVCSTVKLLTGGDYILCRMLYQNTMKLKDIATLWCISNKPGPLDEGATQESEKEAMRRRLLWMINPFLFTNARTGANVKKPNGDVKIFFETPGARDAFLEILISVYHHYVKAMKREGINEIKSVEQCTGFPGNHRIIYPALWQEALDSYRNAGDNVNSFLSDYASNTPPGWKQDSPLWNLYDQKNREQFRNAEGDCWDSAFKKDGFREDLSELYKCYCQDLGKGIRPSKRKVFVQSLINHGFGITKTACNGRDALVSEEVFEIRFKNEGEEEQDMGTLFNAETDVPDRSPGSMLDLLLHDVPLTVSEIHKAPEKVVLLGMLMDPDHAEVAPDFSDGEDDTTAVLDDSDDAEQVTALLLS